MSKSHSVLGACIVVLVVLLAWVYNYSGSRPNIVSIESTGVPYENLQVEMQAPPATPKPREQISETFTLPVRDDVSDSEFGVAYGDVGRFEGFYSGYTIKSDGKVYFLGMLVADADAATFLVIKNGLMNDYGPPPLRYAKDSKRVYYKGIQLAGANPDTFTTLPAENSHMYGTDGKSVYFNAEPIEGADAATFKVLWMLPGEGCPPGRYAKDASSVYFLTRVVPGADPRTFKPLIAKDGDYGQDNRGFYKGTEFLGAEPGEIPECQYG